MNIYVIQESTTGLWCTSSKFMHFTREFDSSVAIFRSADNANKAIRAMNNHPYVAKLTIDGAYVDGTYVTMPDHKFVAVECTVVAKV